MALGFSKDRKPSCFRGEWKDGWQETVICCQKLYLLPPDQRWHIMTCQYFFYQSIPDCRAHFPVWFSFWESWFWVPLVDDLCLRTVFFHACVWCMCVHVHVCPVSSPIPLHLLFIYLEIEPHFVATAGLKLTIQTRLASSSQRPVCLCLCLLSSKTGFPIESELSQWDMGNHASLPP